jgi:hypothetical protein
MHRLIDAHGGDSSKWSDDAVTQGNRLTVVPSGHRGLCAALVKVLGQSRLRDGSIELPQFTTTAQAY